MSNPATRQGSTPAGRPVRRGECEVPQGTLQARMDLNARWTAARTTRGDEGSLLRSGTQLTLPYPCGQGASAGVRCGVDVVEELSSAKRKRRKRDDKKA